MLRSYELSRAEEVGLQWAAKAAGDTAETYFSAVVCQLMRDCVRQMQSAEEARLTAAVKQASPVVQEDIRQYIKKTLGIP